MHRPEHPKPQFQRDKWMNLNGEWKFAFDFGASGDQKGWQDDPSALDMTIQVPFCPESKLSGIGYTDFIPAVWYSREFAIPTDWRGDRVFLHFGAVDYDCRAWVNGTLVGRHYGGQVSFSFEITQALREGPNTLTVCAVDDTRSTLQPLGKQSYEWASVGCRYTRTTGIWQTVWLEARPASFINSVRIVPDLDGGRFVFTPSFDKTARGMQFRAAVLSDGEEIAASTCTASSGLSLEVHLPDARAWSPADPHLYDLQFELIRNGQPVDIVHSYAGLRKFHIEGNKFYLNNKPIFLAFVLDQGFYPDGIWTAPSDGELKADIERSKAVGFNGARLHQKVFEERFHYWADRLGYLTSAEIGDWGPNFDKPQGMHNLQREWMESVLRDVNHPSIVTWTPFNESVRGWKFDREIHRQWVQETVDLTRALDPTRPVNDASGYVHVDTDIYSLHNYEQDVEAVKALYADLTPDARKSFCRVMTPEAAMIYGGQPVWVDEYGGTWWREQADAGAGRDHSVSWGYGNRPASIEEVYARIEGLTAALKSHPNIAGFCYTQLTDVEQEQNGVYTYDRKLKFDPNRLKRAFGAPAAIEQ